MGRFEQIRMTKFKNLGRILWITKMLHRLTTQKLDYSKREKTYEAQISFYTQT